MDALPITLVEAQHLLRTREIHSFWGHNNSLVAASQFTGYDLTPRKNRPAIVLDNEGFPILGGISSREILIFPPEYPEDFRAAIGQEIAVSQILGFRPVLLTFR